MTIWEARSKAAELLKKAETDNLSFSTPMLDCDCLLMHILGENRTFLLSHSHDELDSEKENAFFELINKRITGLPIAYLTSNKEFFGYDFYVNENVLIPKPDTELLVQKTIDIIVNLMTKGKNDFRLADICTGSGCIPLSIIRYILDYTNFDSLKGAIHFDCVDISNSALDVAKINEKKLLGDKKHLDFYLGDLMSPLGGFETYDCILSNPPYIPSRMVDDLLLDGRNEPRLALDGDVDASDSLDGMAIIRRLVPQVYQMLTKGGYFIIETGEYNAHETASLMKDWGFYDVYTYDDLSGQPRVTIGRKK